MELSITEYKKNGGPVFLREICDIQGRAILLKKQRNEQGLTSVAVLEKIRKQEETPFFENNLSLRDRFLLYTFVDRVCRENPGALEVCHSALRQVSDAPLITQLKVIIETLSHPEHPYWNAPPMKTERLEHLLIVHEGKRYLSASSNPFEVVLAEVTQIIGTIDNFLHNIEVPSEEILRELERSRDFAASHLEFSEIRKVLDSYLRRVSESPTAIGQELFDEYQQRLRDSRAFLKVAQANLARLQTFENGIEQFVDFYQVDDNLLEQLRIESLQYNELSRGAKQKVAIEIFRDKNNPESYPSTKKLAEIMFFDRMLALLKLDVKVLLCACFQAIDISQGSLFSMLNLSYLGTLAIAIGLSSDYQKRLYGKNLHYIRLNRGMSAEDFRQDYTRTRIGLHIRRVFLHSLSAELGTLFRQDKQKSIMIEDSLIVKANDLQSACFRWQLNHVFYGEATLTLRNKDSDIARIRPITLMELKVASSEKMVSRTNFAKHYKKYTKGDFKWYLYIENRPPGAVVEPIAAYQTI